MVFQGASLLPADNKQAAAGSVYAQYCSPRLYPVTSTIQIESIWLNTSLKPIVATAVSCTAFTGYSTQGNQIRRTFRNSATTTTAPGDCMALHQFI